MSESTVVCPHCGKELSNPEKLARHLSRECPVMTQEADIVSQQDESQEAASTGYRP